MNADEIYDDIRQNHGERFVSWIPRAIFQRQIDEAIEIHKRMTREEIDHLMSMKDDFHGRKQYMKEIKQRIVERELHGQEQEV